MKNLIDQKTSSKPKRAAFTVGEQVIPAGKTKRFSLAIARSLSGEMHSLPLVVVHGTEPGPVLWLSAAIHGDELNGIPIIRRVLERVDAKTLAGTLIAVPTVNVFGIASGSRYLPDRRDLNRSFPGSKRGSLAAQLAHLFIQEIVKVSDVGIDLHTAAVGRTNLPQIRCNLSHRQTQELAEAFGAPATIDASLRDGSLRAAGHKLGVPVLLFEGGEAGRFDKGAISIGFEGVLRVMKTLGMMNSETAEQGTSTFKKSSWVRARRSGFCEIQTELGAWVRPGDDVAWVFDVFGKSEGRLKSTKAGLVVGHATSGCVHRGDALVHIAES